MFKLVSRKLSAHAHVHGHATPSLLDTLATRLPQMPKDKLTQRLNQLKKNHMKYLSLEINWPQVKGEDKELELRTLDKLVSGGYPTWPADKQKLVNLKNVYSFGANKASDKDGFIEWDALLCKNDDLQLGDWRKMTVDEKKASHYIAFGPMPESSSQFQQSVALRVILLLGVAYGIYYTILTYCRSKKDRVTETPEWREATRKRILHERMNPYTGESAKLFVKGADGKGKILEVDEVN